MKYGENKNLLKQIQELFNNHEKNKFVVNEFI